MMRLETYLSRIHAYESRYTSTDTRGRRNIRRAIRRLVAGLERVTRWRRRNGY